MVGLPWEQHVTFLDDDKRSRSIEQRVRAGVRACAGHPAVLCYAIGNEIPAPIVRWYGRRRVERYLERLYRAAKAEDPGGLHFDLGEWTYRDGNWVTVYEVVPADDVTAVADEAARQLAAFRRLVGREPTHIDSHQHVHRWGPVRSVLVEVARDLAVPLRDRSPKIRYCGDFYGQTGKGSHLPDAISVDGLIKILVALPPGVTELGCHPGVGDDLDTRYRSERTQEVKALCDSRVRAIILAEGIELCSFGNVALHMLGKKNAVS